MFGPYQVAITLFKKKKKKKNSTFPSTFWQSNKAKAIQFAEVTDPAVTTNACGSEGVGETQTILHTK